MDFKKKVEWLSDEEKMNKIPHELRESSERHVVRLFGRDLLGDYQVNDSGGAAAVNRVLEYLQVAFRELLSLERVSFLIGAGSSICLGADSIANVKKFVESIPEEDKPDGCDALVEYYIKRTGRESVEGFLAFLAVLEQAQQYGVQVALNGVDADYAKVRSCIVNSLIERCRVPRKDLDLEAEGQRIGYLRETLEGFRYHRDDPLWIHKQFIRRILSRPATLQRINLFTTNYDLAFEKAMDATGTIYLDGFVGCVRRFFRPSSYNYDFYYPQTRTEGPVHRLEQVLHFYKLHGSIDWVETEDRDAINVYGIERVGEELRGNRRVLIYPTPLKETETLGFPYSEMFRRFANAIQQPQSVLITYGYSFGDDHINRIINDALAIPSFHLVIVSYSFSDTIRKYYERFRHSQERRIGFIIGDFFADWRIFVTKVLPDVGEAGLEHRIAQTMKDIVELQKLRNAVDTNDN